ncbi:MAG: polyketide cyclase [Paenibacillus sp.]|nr:polyketide cyclase [Paenibacillus sp.]
MTNLNHEPIAKVEMLIRRSVEEVFEAFINPTITTKFWFTKAAGDWKRGNVCNGIGKCMVLLQTLM